MSLFIIPTSTSFEHSTRSPLSLPSSGYLPFQDVEFTFATEVESPDFFGLMRRGNSPTSSRTRSQALAQARLQHRLEAQRRAEIERARREELERAYIQQLRMIQAQQIEAERRRREQELQELRLYQQMIEHQRRLAQEEYERRIKLQKAQLERQKRLEAQRQQQQQREQLKLKASSEDPLLLALKELFTQSLVGEESAEQDTRGKAPVRNDVEVEDVSLSSTNAPANVSAEKVESRPQPQPTQTPSRQLVFSHPFPSKEASSSASVQADQISVSIDEQSGTVKVSGLWGNENQKGSNITPNSTSTATTSTPQSPPRPASPALSQHSSTSSVRRRAHVSDVDEDGNEVEEPEVVVDHVESEKKESTPPSNTIPNTSTTTSTTIPILSRPFDRPEGIKAHNPRDEVQDDGFKIFVEAQ